MTQKLYSFDDHPEHKAMLPEWRDKWIANALLTRQMTEEDRTKCRQAIHDMYRIANLPDIPDERIVFVPSPIAARIIGGFAAWIWDCRSKKTNSQEGKTEDLIIEIANKYVDTIFNEFKDSFSYISKNTAALVKELSSETNAKKIKSGDNTNLITKSLNNVLKTKQSVPVPIRNSIAKLKQSCVNYLIEYIKGILDRESEFIRKAGAKIIPNEVSSFAMINAAVRKAIVPDKL